MADPLPPQQVQPNCSYYPIDREFPLHCNVDQVNAYCCDVIGRFEADEFVGCIPELNYCQIGPAGCNMNFPVYNDEGQPMYKTSLGGNTKSAWVRIAFQQYDIGTNLEDPVATWKTILTMGNVSQPFNDERCQATIQGFQYGWGTTNEGNRCRITILDQKGSDFQQWIQRMGINPEGDAVPVQGKYRMKVQFGWYVTGGAETDICGQPPQPLLKIQNSDGDLEPTPVAEGFNSAYIICSPVMYFLTDWINVHWADGKFKYELEGVDLLVRGQENLVSKTYGRDTKKMYFTKAVQLLGQMSFPPFRVEFKALNANGEVVDMQFAPRDGNVEDRTCNSGSDCEKYNFDCEGWGPYDVWDTNASTPLTVIQNWIKKGVFAQDLTGKITSSGGKTGITMNYDPTYKFNQDPATTDPCNLPCTSAAPQYGRLILWANAIPYCQGNFNDDEINARLKAVYIVNGGNCVNGNSTVLTEDGWERIEKLFKFKYSGKVACVVENGTLTWSKVNNWYRNKLNDRKLIKIHLHNSRQRSGSISGAIFTEDHPVLTDRGYVEIKDLKITEDLIHSGTYCPSQEVHEAVIGMMLGDGYIRNKSYSFNCTHCGKQKEYIEHKAKLLNLETLDKPDKKFKKIKITSKASPYWRSLRKLFYPEGTKVINKAILKDFSIISLAFLYMDDGSLRQEKKLAEIATCCFAKEEVDLLIARIKELGINCYRRKNSKYPRIYFNIKETIKLCNAIAPYIIKSMDYKLLPEYRLENKNKLNLESRPFYDTFDLIRCEKLEKTTKYVYCIGVEKYNNFITHSGVVHNCSPVIAFNPSFRWRQTAAMKGGGAANPGITNGVTGVLGSAIVAMANQVIGMVKANCAIASTPGLKRQAVPMATRSTAVTLNPPQMTQEAVYHQIMTNMAIGVIEATLRVQGDPSYWLCTPVAGMGRCVGIVFINPYFLVRGATSNDCPVWASNDPDNPDDQFKSICNELLTNKGWFVMGVDHQIKDGQYVTELRLRLVAPGAELNPAGSIVNLGGWKDGPTSGGIPLPYGGQFGCLNKNLVGSAAAGWALQSGSWVGGGTLCGNNYTDTGSEPLPPD